MHTTTVIATTWPEAAIAIAVILGAGALVLLVVWQLFGLARRAMELRAQPGTHGSEEHPRAEADRHRDEA